MKLSPPGARADAPPPPSHPIHLAALATNAAELERVATLFSESLDEVGKDLDDPSFELVSATMRDVLNTSPVLVKRRVERPDWLAWAASSQS